MLNNIVPKHCVPALPGLAAGTRLDGLNPNADALTVRFILHVCGCQVMPDMGGEEYNTW